jgi:hypothetical protein
MRNNDKNEAKQNKKRVLARLTASELDHVNGGKLDPTVVDSYGKDWASRTLSEPGAPADD